MKPEKITGILLILGAVGVLIPYTILTMTFDYPNILRQDAGVILTKFHEGGSPLIFTWFAFAILGLPLLAAYVLLGQILENKFYLIRLATTLGIISGIVQIIGLLRWTFVVPVLADTYVNTSVEASREATTIVLMAVHQFAGVLLGEHLGQLFTILWTIMMAYALHRLQLIPKWVAWLGYIGSAIYLLAQAELFATVIPNFPVWNLAGFIGSTLWLVWLTIVGIKFLKVEIVR